MASCHTRSPRRTRPLASWYASWYYSDAADWLPNRWNVISSASASSSPSPSPSYQPTMTMAALTTTAQSMACALSAARAASTPTAPAAHPMPERLSSRPSPRMR